MSRVEANRNYIFLNMGINLVSTCLILAGDAPAEGASDEQKPAEEAAPAEGEAAPAAEGT